MPAAVPVTKNLKALQGTLKRSLTIQRAKQVLEAVTTETRKTLGAGIDAGRPR